MSRSGRWVLILAGLALAAPASRGFAADPDRVEEDWRLVVETPDVAGVGPQVTTSMSPVADRSQAPFVAFDLNYREYPSFSSGGYQAQVWSGDDLVQYSQLAETSQFATAGETVTWTQRMTLFNGRIYFTVPAGASTTWGSFGTTTLVSFGSSLTSLAGYTPTSSVTNSGVSWQVNNVRELTLVAVRYYSGSTLLSTDSTPRTLVSNGALATSSLMRPDPLPLALRADAPGPVPMPAAFTSRRSRRGELARG